MKIKKIKLNFLPTYVMFYDWLKSDNIKEYCNINVYRVSNDTIKDFIKYQVKVNKKDFIINTPIVFSDTYNSIAIIFDENGFSISKSSLLLNDELRINDDVRDIKLNIFNYDKSINCNSISELRQITNIKKTLISELETIEKNNDIYKLEYFYYELFNKKGNNFKNMIKQINNKINSDITEKEIYLYELVQKCYKLV